MGAGRGGGAEELRVVKFLMSLGIEFICQVAGGYLHWHFPCNMM